MALFDYLFFLQELDSIVKTKVIFEGKKTSNGDFTDYITYEEEVSIGEGFDASTGTFTTPMDGLYQFSFSGRSSSTTDVTFIRVYKNGDEVGIRISDRNTAGHGNNIAFIWLMELSRNDQIRLKIDSDDLVYAQSSFPVIWTGQLLHKM